MGKNDFLSPKAVRCNRFALVLTHPLPAPPFLPMETRSCAAADESRWTLGMLHADCQPNQGQRPAEAAVVLSDVRQAVPRRERVQVPPQLRLAPAPDDGLRPGELCSQCCGGRGLHQAMLLFATIEL